MKRKEESIPLARSSWKGLGTIEVIIIIAILMALAMVFSESLMDFGGALIEEAFDLDPLTFAK